MAPMLPRVPAFPIVGEKSVLTVLGTGLSIPASVQEDCPLIGKVAPEILLPDHLGRRCSLHATIALGRPIILFFFPLAGSPHCTKESCLFRDALGLTPVFSDLQAIVIGISQDPPSRSKRFVDEHHLGYQILHDERREAMDLYGVPRTWMGLIDQRCTFVIDPSGIVRSMAQGVLDADGHVTFAERWLIRLEEELSLRSRQVLAYDGNEADLIVRTSEGGAKQVRVAYGDANSAGIGGIDAVPRHGAMSYSSAKRPQVHSADARAKEHKTTNGERNIWRNWKSMLQQLSSPDDQPPPLVMARRRNTETSDESKSPQSRQTSHKGFARSLPRSRSATRLKDVGKASSRRGSSARQSIESASEQRKIRPMRDATQNDAVPPVPSLFSAVDAINMEAEQRDGSYASNGIHAANHDGLGGSVSASPLTAVLHQQDSESSDRETSLWGTESSLSSHVSTAATSVPGSRYSNGSSVVLPPGGIVQNGQHYMLAKPSVTSEVLMPGEVLDLSGGALPMVIRQNTSATPLAARKKPVPSLPDASQRDTLVNGDSHRLSGASAVRSSNVGHGPAGVSSSSPSSSSSTRLASLPPPIKRFDVPQDVPQDESVDESSATDGLNLIGASPMTKGARSFSQQSGHTSGRSTPRANRPGVHGMNGVDLNTRDHEADVESGRSSSPLSHAVRSQHYRNSSVTDGVFRISAEPTLADAAERAQLHDVEPKLSPRPRSARLEYRSDGRLRRPMNPPKDVPVVRRLSKHVRQLSLTEQSGRSSPHSSAGDVEDLAAHAGEDDATIQRVVRRTSIRSGQPTVVESTRNSTRMPSQQSVHKATFVKDESSTPLDSSNDVFVDAKSALSSGMHESASSSNESNHGVATNESSPGKNAVHVEAKDLNGDARRPSATSLGTFGRRSSRGSDREESEE